MCDDGTLRMAKRCFRALKLDVQCECPTNNGMLGEHERPRPLRAYRNARERRRLETGVDRAVDDDRTPAGAPRARRMARRQECLVIEAHERRGAHRVETCPQARRERGEVEWSGREARRVQLADQHRAGAHRRRLDVASATSEHSGKEDLVTHCGPRELVKLGAVDRAGAAIGSRRNAVEERPLPGEVVGDDPLAELDPFELGTAARYRAEELTPRAERTRLGIDIHEPKTRTGERESERRAASRRAELRDPEGAVSHLDRAQREARKAR